MAVKFVCMAGGQGTRFQPLTLFLQKELYPISGKPFLAYTLDNLAEITDEVTLFVSERNKHQFEAFFERVYASVHSELLINYVTVPTDSTLLSSIREAVLRMHSNLIVWLGDTYVPRKLFRDLMATKENAVSVAKTCFQPVAPVRVQKGQLATRGELRAHTGVYKFNYAEMKHYFLVESKLDKPFPLVYAAVRDKVVFKAVENPVWLHLGDKQGRSWQDNKKLNEHAFMEVSTFFTNHQFMLCPGKVKAGNKIVFDSRFPMCNYHERDRNKLKDYVVAAAAILTRFKGNLAVLLVQRSGLADYSGKWALIPAGASDNIEEMLYPRFCLNREIREELLVKVDNLQVDPLSVLQRITTGEQIYTTFDYATNRTGWFSGYLFETETQIVLLKLYFLKHACVQPPIIEDGEKEVGRQLLNRKLVWMPTSKLFSCSKPCEISVAGVPQPIHKIDLTGSQTPTFNWFRSEGMKNVLLANIS